MTNKEKLQKLKKLADDMYYAYQYLTTDSQWVRKAMQAYHKFIVYEYYEKEPMENSISCKVAWFDGSFLDYTQEQQDKVLEKIGAKTGDKIRVFFVKEED